MYDPINGCFLPAAQGLDDDPSRLPDGVVSPAVLLSCQFLSVPMCPFPNIAIVDALVEGELRL